jgi:hypothetical protein
MAESLGALTLNPLRLLSSFSPPSSSPVKRIKCRHTQLPQDYTRKPPTLPLLYPPELITPSGSSP